MFTNACISYDFSLIKPQITFNQSLDHMSFASLMTNYSSSIKPGIQLGKENGLTLLLGNFHQDFNPNNQNYSIFSKNRNLMSHIRSLTTSIS